MSTRERKNTLHSTNERGKTGIKPRKREFSKKPGGHSVGLQARGLLIPRKTTTREGLTGEGLTVTDERKRMWRPGSNRSHLTTVHPEKEGNRLGLGTIGRKRANAKRGTGVGERVRVGLNAKEKKAKQRQNLKETLHPRVGWMKKLDQCEKTKLGTSAKDRHRVRWKNRLGRNTKNNGG